MRGQASDTAAVQATCFTQVCLEQLRRELHAFALDRHKDQWHTPCNLLLAMIAEVGVLAEIFQWGKGEVPPSLADWSASERHHVGRELSGVLFYLIRMADVCGVDLGRAALDKLATPEALGPAQSDPHSSGAGLSPSQQHASPQQQKQQQPAQERKHQQQQYGARLGLGTSSPLQPSTGQAGALSPSQQQQQQWQQLTTAQQQQQRLAQQQQPLPPRPLPQRQQLAASALHSAAAQRARSPAAGAGRAAVHGPAAAAAAAALAGQGLLPAGTGPAGGAALSPVSSSISSISVGLLRQLAMLASINPSAAIGLLTANPAATASLMAAITDPNHQVSALLSAALVRGVGGGSSSSGQGLDAGGVAAGLRGLRANSPRLSSTPAAAAAAGAADVGGAASAGWPSPQQQQQQERPPMTPQQQLLLSDILAAAAAARGQAAGPAPAPLPAAFGAFAAAPAPAAQPAAGAEASAAAKMPVSLAGGVSTAAAAAAGKGAPAVVLQGAPAPITPPAATPADAGTTVLPAFAAPVAAARGVSAGATAAGSEGCEAALHSSPSPARQQQRQPTLLPHSQPQQQVTRSLSRSPRNSSSSGDAGSGGTEPQGRTGTAAVDSGPVDQPMHEAHSPQQPMQQLAVGGAAAAVQPLALASPSAATGDSAATAMAAAGGVGAGASIAQQQQQQQQQQVTVPVRQQLDAQQLTHLTQIAQAAHWSIATLSTEQREAVCTTLGIGLDLVARFLEEEGAAATGGAPRGVKRGVQDR